MILDTELIYRDIYEGKGENSIKEIAKNASDIIMFNYDIKLREYVYHNYMTGKKDRHMDNVIRTGKKYIFLSLSTTINGYFIYHNKKHDVLVVKLARITNTKKEDIQHWEPIKESENRTNTIYESCFVFEKNGSCYIPFRPAIRNSLRKLDSEKFIDAFSSKSASSIFENRDYSISLIRDFFGDTICSGGLNFLPVNNLSVLSDISKINEIKKNADKNIKTEKNCDLQEISIENKKKAYNIFLQTFSVDEVNYIKNYYHYYQRMIDTKKFKISFLDKLSDKLSVIRIFYIAPDVLRINKRNIPLLEDDLIIDEVIRIYCSNDTFSIYKKASKEWYLCPNGLRAINFDFVLLDAPDDAITNCKLKYFKHQIEACLNSYKKIEDKAEFSSQSLAECVKSSAELYSSLTFSLYESFIKMGLNNLAMHFDPNLSPKSKLKKLFGDINDKETSITKAIGIPTFMLKELDKILLEADNKAQEHLTAYTIKIMKYTYKDNIEYFESMNKEQFIELLSNFNNFNYWAFFHFSHCSVEGFIDDIKNMFYILVKHNGYKNLSNCIKDLLKVSQNMKYLFLHHLKDYITMSDIILENNEEIRCKFNTAEDFKNSHDYIVAIYNLKSNEKKNEEYTEKFKKRISSWKKYVYSDDTYSIIYPECYLDIANEGITLHHCVKSYIDSVVEGKTNILFIRKNEQLDKPFFTLEIRDNTVRQCHGFANCKTDTVEGLDDFLKKYCENKKIKYTNGNSVLAV